MELIFVVISLLMPFIMVLYNEHIKNQNFDNIIISQDSDTPYFEFFAKLKSENLKEAYGFVLDSKQ